MTERQVFPENNHPFSVPPVFVSADTDVTDGRGQPRRNADEGSNAPKRSDETTPGGEALDDTGEDNQRSKSDHD